MNPRRLSTAVLIAAALALPPLSASGADGNRSAPAAATALSKDDLRYFQRLAEGNVAEIESGKLASQKAVAEDVRKFAAHMVEEHGKMLDELRAMGQSKGIALPAAPNKEHASAMKRLQSQSGATFDRSYMTQMAKDHDDTLKLVKDIASKAKDPDLKAAGEKAVPRVQEHLDMAKRIASTTELPDKVQQNAPRK